MKPNQVNFWWRRIIFSPNRIAVLICSLAIFCLLTDTYARTWGDDFNDGNLDGWTEEHDPNTTWQAKDGSFRCHGEVRASSTLGATYDHRIYCIPARGRTAPGEIHHP